MQWAVLVGLNYYADEPCLQGSVRDVSTVAAVLRNAHPPADVKLLTATEFSGIGHHTLQEPPESRATKDNVVSALKRVISKSQRGDFVYFHFSGHGTRMTMNSTEKYAKYAHAQGNIALVLHQEQSARSEYLRGANLALAFRQMVERGLRVTVILDCCHSGSVLRDDIPGTSIRETLYKATVEVARPSAEIYDFPSSGIERSSLSSDQWLIDPNGYVILTACGPHETAAEITQHGTGLPVCHGALSYLLMQALAAVSNSTQLFTHKSLYSHLRVTFQARWPQQTPMMYGKSDYSMFGHPGVMAIRNTLSQDQSISVFWPKDIPSLWLNAGEAHMVERGDEFDLRPPVYAAKEADQPIALARVRVTEARALTSTLVSIKAEEDLSRVENGWLATRISRFPGKRISVRVMPGATSLLGSTDSTDMHRFVVHTDQHEKISPQACLFNIDLSSSKNNLEILDAKFDKMPNVPAIRAIPSSKQRLLDILDHMSTFKLLEQVEKLPGPDFQTKFAIRASIDASKSFTEATFLEIRHGQNVIFSVESYTDKPLYLALFSFTSNWEVKNILPASGSGEFFVLSPRDSGPHEPHKYENAFRFILTMTIPEVASHHGHERCIEILKFFVTTKATTFPRMVLPDITDRFERNAESNRSAALRLHEEDIWSTLQSLQQAPVPQRDENSHTELEHWASKSYVVHVRK